MVTLGKSEVVRSYPVSGERALSDGAWLQPLHTRHTCCIVLSCPKNFSAQSDPVLFCASDIKRLEQVTPPLPPPPPDASYCQNQAQNSYLQVQGKFFVNNKATNMSVLVPELCLWDFSCPLINFPFHTPLLGPPCSQLWHLDCSSLFHRANQKYVYGTLLLKRSNISNVVSHHCFSKHSHSQVNMN